MSQIDPTGVDNASDEGLGDQNGQLTYEEVSGMSNIELGLGDHDHPPASFAPESFTAPFALAKAIPLQAAPLPQAPPLAAPRAPLAALPVKKDVSGCYGGALGAFRLELRVDVDRSRPMRRVSGDLYQMIGKTVSYFGSFVVDNVTVTGTTQMVVRGLGRFTFAASAPVVQVTIPRVNLLQPQAAATLQFFTMNNMPGASYHCPFTSLNFRSVRIETDCASDLGEEPFASYHTASLPSGGAPRILSVVGAYAEAGIGMAPTGGNNIIDVTGAGQDAVWSDAELHASMQKHFSLWSDLQQWCVWLLAARSYDGPKGIQGIMFDQQGKQRQGCAVFHGAIGGAPAERLRQLLYVYTHELGHCFNLLHSWGKSAAIPPRPNRPEAMSWMNYPWKFPNGGEPGFWNGFDFRFDDEELIHLRHGFRNDVIMGGKNFLEGSALGRDVMADPISDESGLALTISTHRNNLALGEPVVLQLKLRATDTRGRRVHTWLHPDYGLVKVVISKPNGELLAYEPMMDYLVGDRQGILGVGEEENDSAYIGYGRDGFYFDQPGMYRVRASYSALDGSQVLSDILNIRVRYPVSPSDDQLAELFMGEEQGTLLYLRGSDNASLRAGNEAFDEVLDRFDTHPMAAYARMVKGFNAGRAFKTVSADPGKSLKIRSVQSDESIGLLSSVIKSGVLEPVFEQETRECLAKVQKHIGDDAGARKTMAKGHEGDSKPDKK